MEKKEKIGNEQAMGIGGEWMKVWDIEAQKFAAKKIRKLSDVLECTAAEVEHFEENSDTGCGIAEGDVFEDLHSDEGGDPGRYLRMVSPATLAADHLGLLAVGDLATGDDQEAVAEAEDAGVTAWADRGDLTESPIAEVPGTDLRRFLDTVDALVGERYRDAYRIFHDIGPENGEPGIENELKKLEDEIRNAAPPDGGPDDRENCLRSRATWTPLVHTYPDEIKRTIEWWRKCAAKLRAIGS